MESTSIALFKDARTANFFHVHVIIFAGIHVGDRGSVECRNPEEKESLTDYDLKDEVVNLTLVRIWGDLCVALSHSARRFSFYNFFCNCCAFRTLKLQIYMQYTNLLNFCLSITIISDEIDSFPQQSFNNRRITTIPKILYKHEKIYNANNTLKHNKISYLPTSF